jgi:hypothetical protein
MTQRRAGSVLDPHSACVTGVLGVVVAEWRVRRLQEGKLEQE